MKNMSVIQRSLWIISIALLMFTPQSARASGGGSFSVEDEWFLPFGMNIGYTTNDKGIDGFLLGGELSLVYMASDQLFVGGFADVNHDFGRDVTRVVIGPEVGWLFFGVDAGLAIELTEPDTRLGVALRPFASFLGFASLYLRVEVFETAPVVIGEVGLLLKFPLPIDDI